MREKPTAKFRLLITLDYIFISAGGGLHVLYTCKPQVLEKKELITRVPSALVIESHICVLDSVESIYLHARSTNNMNDNALLAWKLIILITCASTGLPRNKCI